MALPLPRLVRWGKSVPPTLSKKSKDSRPGDEALTGYFRDCAGLSNMRQHLDLAAVEAFLLVAELHSFTRAADVLGVTQAGVSLQLRRLEAQLGQRLLDRTPRHVRLSAQGEAFLPHARDLLASQQTASRRWPCQAVR